MARFSLAGRISIIIILTAVLSASISGIMNLMIAKNQFADYVDTSTINMAANISSSAVEYYDKKQTLAGFEPEMLPGHMGAGNGRMNRMHRFQQGTSVLVLNQTGDVVYDSTGLGVQSFDGEDSAYPIILKNGKSIGSLYVASPLKSGIQSLENTFVDNLSTQIIISILIVSFFALLFGIFLSRGIILPLSKLSAGIHGLAKGDLDVRVQPRGDRELYSLGSDFNLMAQKLQDNEESRRLLVSNIAHELRTPLSILRGRLEAIQTGKSQVTEEISSSLVDEVIRLTRLVTDLETIGLAESGNLAVKKERISFDEILERLLPLRLAMEGEGIQYQEKIDEHLQSVEADLNRLIQVLINLLSNAMRYSKPGDIILLEVSEKDADVLFAVKDQGPGISGEDLKRIFERFYRTDESRSRYAGGTGLGLAIARGYVEAHGGRIWAESQPGKGTTFFFTIPNS